MSTEPKLCDGCGKDLSNGGGYADEPHVGFPKLRCAPCKIAKDTHRIAALEAAAKAVIKDLDEVMNSLSVNDTYKPARRAVGTLGDILTDHSFPSRNDGKVVRR